MRSLMPQAPKRPCTFPHCPTLVQGGGRCGAHKAVEQRGTSSARGYDGVWQRFRAWFLRQPENVVCADCKREASRDVHHKIKLRERPDLRLDPLNCMGLCGACHKARTARGE